MSTALLAVALVWSVVLAVLLQEHVRRRDAWYAALDVRFESGGEPEGL